MDKIRQFFEYKKILPFESKVDIKTLCQKPMDVCKKSVPLFFYQKKKKSDHKGHSSTLLNQQYQYIRNINIRDFEP